MRRWTIAALAVVFAALAAAPAARLVGEWQLRSARLTEADVDALIDVERHLATIDALFPLKREDRGRDAGDLLNPLLALDDGTPPTAAQPWWADEDVHIMVMWGRTSSQRPPVKDIAGAWLHAPELMPPGDLSITSELLAYDHWHPESSGAYARAIAEPSPAGAYRAPIPNMIPLVTLGKLRLSAGLRDGDVMVALQEVRHLARLTADGESLVDHHVAIALLRLEVRTAEQAVATGLLAEGEWSPVPDEDLDGARDVLSMLPAIYQGRAPAGSVGRLDAIGAPPYGRCAGLSEALGRATIEAAAVGGSAASHLPEVTVDLLATGTCRLPQERLYAAHPELVLDPWGMLGQEYDPANNGHPPAWLGSIPLVRAGLLDHYEAQRTAGLRGQWRRSLSPP